MSKGLLLISFAWAMEIVGVTAGAFNSIYTTFGDDLPSSIWGYVPALPLLALAVAESGRVPLASVLFNRHRFTQCIAILGLLALGYLALENWTFGFERVVDLRLKPVNLTQGELVRAKTALSSLEAHYQETTASSRQKRDELRHAIEQRDGSIVSLTGQLSSASEVHQKNLEGIREACRIIRDKCMLMRSQSEDARYEAEVGRLAKTLQNERDERNSLRSQIDSLVSADASESNALNQRIAAARINVAEAQQAFRATTDRNQIYRLAASWYGVSTSDVTEAQFAWARWVFSTFGAMAVATAGTIAALVYYARARVPGSPTLFALAVAKLIRARRAYYARQRKPIVREIPGPERLVYRDGKEPPTIVEKEVVRLIDQIFLIPRWGIKSPIHVNSLLRSDKSERNSGPEGDNGGDNISNVTPLKQRGA